MGKDKLSQGFIGKPHFFVSPKEGFFVGYKLKPSSSPMDNGSVIMSTADSGQNWETVYSLVDIALYKLVFNSDGFGVAVGKKILQFLNEIQ